MGGKAKRRREKNYLAAHGGGNARLPPPPDASSVDVVPSKLRKIMSFTGGKESIFGAKKNSINAEKRQALTDESEGKSDKIKKNDEETLVTEDPDNVYDDVPNKDTEEKKKKKKRKRNQVNDLRFEESDKLVGTGSKRKERRKLRNEERKKKRKGKNENLDSLNQDIVRFGDVVKAPPKLDFAPKNKGIELESRIKAINDYTMKITTPGPGNGNEKKKKKLKVKNENLNSFPKTPKGIHDPNQERLRLQAINDYRMRKGRNSAAGLLDADLSVWSRLDHISKVLIEEFPCQIFPS